jgi:hypothetical protein
MGICHQKLDKKPSLRDLYISLETFFVAFEAQVGSFEKALRRGETAA